MKKEICELPGCQEEIPSTRHRNAKTCCEEHGKLLKKMREAANYQKIRQSADPILWLRQHLYYIADEYGFEVPIDIIYVSPFQIDWSLKTGTFQKDGEMGVELGDIGYILYKPQSIKIFKL